MHSIEWYKVEIQGLIGHLLGEKSTQYLTSAKYINKYKWLRIFRRNILFYLNMHLVYCIRKYWILHLFSLHEVGSKNNEVLDNLIVKHFKPFVHMK